MNHSGHVNFVCERCGARVGGCRCMEPGKREEKVAFTNCKACSAPKQECRACRAPFDRAKLMICPSCGSAFCPACVFNHRDSKP